MKKFFTQLSIICCLFAYSNLSAQNSVRQRNNAEINKPLPQTNIKLSPGDRLPKFKNVVQQDMGDCLLVAPALGSMSVLFTDFNDDGEADGFVVGTNPWGDLQKAEFLDFSSSQPNNYINGVIIFFAYAQSENLSKIVPIRVYDGTNGTVGAELGYTNITMKEIKDSVDKDMFVAVGFNNIALPASKKVFVSVDLSNLDYYEGDLLGIYSSDFNELPVNTGWELWSKTDGTPDRWIEYSAIGNYEANVTTAMIPIIGENNFCLQIVTPVTFSSFNASKYGSSNIVNWSTQTESGNKGFEVQRSTDGVNFTTIAFVPSLANNGNSTSTLLYSYTDNNVAAGNNYYRIKQVDINDKSVFTKTLMVFADNSVKQGIVKTYPNPAKNNLNVIIDVSNGKKANLQILDVAGKIVLNQTVQGSSSNQSINLNIANLAKGTYMIKLTGDGETKLVKFIKE